MTEQSTPDRFKSVKEAVRSLLDRFPDCRNDDDLLAWYFMRYTQGIELPWEDFQKIKSLKLETVRRCRQFIQNDEGLYPPTDPQVLEKRRAKQKSFRRILAGVVQA